MDPGPQLKVFGVRKLVNYPREHPHFYDWMNKTFRQKLDEFFMDEDLKLLLCALLGYVGARAERVSAASALTACVSYYIQEKLINLICTLYLSFLRKHYAPVV
ncbi:MAG: hypothetical protein QXQ42_05590 [Candidatus Bathyarchaeia archaeon]